MRVAGGGRDHWRFGKDMRTIDVRVYPADRPPPREEQLAWHLALMAAGKWPEDAAVTEMAANRIIDNAAVALCAIDRAPPAAARAQALAHPRADGATVLGLSRDQRFECGWAAWANATAVRELDFHDNFMAAESAHPGDNISAIIAVAQQCGRGGRDVVRAIATAYEAQIALCTGIPLNPHRIDHVGHLGPSIAAGLGALLNLEPDVIYQAIQHAAHVSTATRQGRKGVLSSWKAFAPGHVGKCAIEALDRAMRGETSPSPVYEGDYGILATLLDGPDALYRVTLPSAGETPRGILATYTKEHSAGYHGQAIIDLAFRMRLRIEDTNTIERVDIYSKRPTHVVMGSGSGDPQKYDPAASRETLDHSAMYIFAVALEDGEWHHERSYAPERRRRPETLALWRKVTTHEDEEWNRRYYDEPDSLKKDQGARIEITLAGGEKVVDELSVGNAHPRGATPFQRPDYISKFDTLTESIVSRNEAERFLGVVDRLARLDGDELAGLNVAADAISLSHAVRNREGIF